MLYFMVLISVPLVVTVFFCGVVPVIKIASWLVCTYVAAIKAPELE